MTGRALASVAPDYLGVPLLIQLKPGGGGAIGSDLVASARPDGYTLLFGGSGHNTALPAIQGRSKGPDDLATVCRINYSATIVVAHADAPYRTLKEMVEWAKANPGKLIFASGGPWGQSEVSWRQIAKLTGITAKIVPYDGGGPALVAVLGGHADVVTGFSASLLPHIQSGKFRALAILDHQRDKGLPEIPTAKEQGIDVVNLMWRAILAPQGTPRPVIEKLATAFKRITEDKTLVTMIKRFGDDIYYLGPDEFAKEWREEYEAHKELGKQFSK